MTLVIGGAQRDACPPVAMHSSALQQRLCPYSICFLYVYLVSHGGGITNQTSLATVDKCKDVRLEIFSCFGGYYQLSNYSTLVFLTPCIALYEYIMRYIYFKKIFEGMKDLEGGVFFVPIIGCNAKVHMTKPV